MELIFYAQPQAPRRTVVLAEDTGLRACQAASNCLVGLVGEELPTLSRSHRGERYMFSTTLTIGSGRGHFSAWSQLMPHVLPLHDLIISDRYLLKDREVFAHNYRGLLQAFAQERRSKLNVLLLTSLPETADATAEYSWLQALTTKTLEAVTGTTPNFTVVWSERTADIRHDRHVITNYQWLSSGDSFLYFWPNGQLHSHGDTLTIHNLANSEIRPQADEVLKRMQYIVNKLQPHLNLVQGDKISSFLRFY